MNAPSSAQKTSEQRSVISLADIEHTAPDVYQAIEVIRELAPIATAGPVTTPFVRKGVLVKIPEIEEAMILDQGLCTSAVGKTVFYDKDGSGRDLYLIHSNISEKAEKHPCNVSLQKIEMSPQIDTLTSVVLDREMTDVASKKLIAANSSIVLTKIYVNRLGETVDVSMYEELGGSTGFLAQTLGVQTPAGPGGNPTKLAYAYNFVLERAIKVN